MTHNKLTIGAYYAINGRPHKVVTAVADMGSAAGGSIRLGPLTYVLRDVETGETIGLDAKYIERVT